MLNHLVTPSVGYVWLDDSFSRFEVFLAFFKKRISRQSVHELMGSLVFKVTLFGKYQTSQAQYLVPVSFSGTIFVTIGDGVVFAQTA